MTYRQPSRAPESCRQPLCDYLIPTPPGASEPHDACQHKIPMHPDCAWHRTPEQVALINAREADMAAKVVRIHPRRSK